MNNIPRRVAGFLGRIRNREDVVQVTQSKEKWEQQFESGAWEYLTESHPNTSLIAGAILHSAVNRTELLRVLDVGCGNGALGRLLRLAGATVRYEGLDVSEKAIAQARETVPEGVFYAAPAENPPERLGEFDILVFNEVFFYINADTLLPAYARHLKKGGRVVVSVIRSWRSPFVWHRVARHLSVQERFVVKDNTRDHVFDIALGTLAQSV